MRLVVGCPIRDRAWITPSWIGHVATAVEAASEEVDDVEAAFVGSPRSDPATFAAIEEHVAPVMPVTVLDSGESSAGARSYRRNWNRRRFVEMTELRNQLLRDAVRAKAPDLFWSLDSDILTNEQSLQSALDLLQTTDFDAVGQACFMSSHAERHPSFAMMNPAGGGLIRSYQPGPMRVDVIMAAKVMTPPAYAVDYAVHRLGEDVGWSLAARRHGLILGWDGQVVSKHVMRPEDLNAIDHRCGY